MKLEQRFLPVQVLFFCVLPLIPFMRHITSERLLVASIVFGFGVVLLLVSIFSFRYYGTTPDPINTDGVTALVTTGVYAWTRS